MKRGVTLVELIVSVALLSVMGGLVLQTFLHAQALNRNSWDADKALSAAVSAIERMKSATGSGQPAFSEPSNGGTARTEAQNGGTEAAAESGDPASSERDALTAAFPDAEISVIDGTWDLFFWYDDAWTSLPASGSEGSPYRMTLHVEPDADSGMKTGLLTVVVERTGPLKGVLVDARELVRLTAGIETAPKEDRR